MKHTVFYAAAALVLLCLFVWGCAAKSGVEAEDVREAFLTVCGTYNYEGRYEAWKTSTDELEEMTADEAGEKIRDAQREYYAAISDCVTPEFYERMIANRDPLKYEKLAYEKGFSYRTDGFEFEEYSKNGGETTYSFVAYLTVTDSEGVERRGSVKGQIAISEADGKTLVSNLCLSPLGFVADEGQWF